MVHSSPFRAIRSTKDGDGSEYDDFWVRRSKQQLADKCMLPKGGLSSRLMLNSLRTQNPHPNPPFSTTPREMLWCLVYECFTGAIASWNSLFTWLGEPFELQM